MAEKKNTKARNTKKAAEIAEKPAKAAEIKEELAEVPENVVEEITEEPKEITEDLKEIAENEEEIKENVSETAEDVAEPKEEIKEPEDKTAEPGESTSDSESGDIATADAAAAPDKKITMIPVDLPEGAPSFEEFSASLKSSKEISVVLRKANPNLDNDKSKWTCEVVRDNLRHIFFKGGFSKALHWAQNWCLEHDIDPSKIRKITQ